MKYLSGYVIFAAFLLVSLLVSCGRSDPIPCTDTCQNPGDTRCNGAVLQVCADADRHCTQWQDWVDCSYYDQVCAESNGTAECSMTCSDNCDAAGDTRCSGTVIQTCALGEKGCLGWVSGNDCSVFGEVCDVSEGQAHCTVVCEDECTLIGSSECGGTFILTCARDYYGCLYWEYGRDCADDGLVCIDSTGDTACGPCISDCSGRQCGPDPVCGQNCGTCMGATEVCRLDSGICEDVCTDKDCGTFEGIYCGTCAGATEICRQNTGLCEDVCASRECGIFEDIDCGECSGSTEVCRPLAGQCEDVCLWQECGEVEGKDCGSCPGDEICVTGQCFVPVCSDGMCDVPAGNFWMGCNEDVDIFCDSDEYPYHEVYLDAFEIDMIEVTQGQYFLCVLDSGRCQLPSWGFDPDVLADYPVVEVTNSMARIYCNWTGKRLCTEAEWEKAARGTDGRRYPWGNEPASCDRAVMHDGGDGCGTGASFPVGSKPLGASPYGALDMAGNVSEWVSDIYSETYYQDCVSECNNPQGPSEWGGPVPEYSIRGGYYHSVSRDIRVSERRKFWGGGYLLGFRCCR